MATFNGTSGNDKIWGTQRDDLIQGLEGNDYLNGRGGNDKIYGGTGADKLDGGAGGDLLIGGEGIDALFGGAGNDYLSGGGGGEYLNGGTGDDYIIAASFHGVDKLRGDAGNDWLIGGDGDNYMGGTGDDALVYTHVGQGDPDGLALLNGGPGDDTLIISKLDSRVIISEAGVGYFAAETTTGTALGGTVAGIEHFEVIDDATLWYTGRPDDVTVTGGARDDSFGSGAGDEVFTGGDGGDSYQFRWFPGDNLGHDTITDFTVGQDSLASNYADPDTGSHILDVIRTETGTGTRFQAHDAGTLVHTLDVVGVFGLPDGMLHQPMGVFGPIA